MRHWVFVTLKQVNGLKLQVRNFKLSTCFRIKSTKCRINTIVSPDDGHIVARNM